MSPENQKTPPLPSDGAAAQKGSDTATTPEPIKSLGQRNLEYDLEQRFGVPQTTDEQLKRMADNREAVKRCADHLISNAGRGSREVSIALTELEKALYFANAAIERNG